MGLVTYSMLTSSAALTKQMKKTYSSSKTVFFPAHLFSRSFFMYINALVFSKRSLLWLSCLIYLLADVKGFIRDKLVRLGLLRLGAVNAWVPLFISVP